MEDHLPMFDDAPPAAEQPPKKPRKPVRRKSAAKKAIPAVAPKKRRKRRVAKAAPVVRRRGRPPGARNKATRAALAARPPYGKVSAVNGESTISMTEFNMTVTIVRMLSTIEDSATRKRIVHRLGGYV